MNIIIGTAGHVDHGKTELIKALTGRNTDRLDEEKKRGISIVLGFAPLSLAEGLNVGVVDVPGHERFVKTMVTGAVGVDLALLVVAADEGVMPQTEEHMEVLRLLGVEKGVVAITKTDLVDEETVEFVEEEVREFVSGTFLDGAEVVRTSVVTTEGIEELRNALTRAALSIEKRRSGDFFRMPIDRIFTMQGIGTIVTGTTWSGEVRKGDELVVEPIGRAIRIRDVQSFDRSLDSATSGLRTALAVHGVKRDELEIGHQIVTPGVLESTGIINALLEVSPVKGAGVKTRQRIRFHHAAKEILGRVVIIGKEVLSPGEKGYVQLRLEEPAVAKRGDRFVIRSYSPMRVIAGGVILDPVALKAREKHFPDILKELRVLDDGSREDIVGLLVERSGVSGMDERELLRFGLSRAEIEGVVETLSKDGKIVKMGTSLFSGGLVKEKIREMLEIVKSSMKENRLKWGMEREELRAGLGLSGSPLFDLLMELGTAGGDIFTKGSLVRVGSRDMALSDEEERRLQRIEKRVKQGGFEFARVDDLVETTGDRDQLLSGLKLLEERGSVKRITQGVYIHSAFYARLLEMVRDVIISEGRISIGRFKEMFGLSRKFAVPLLEHLDGIGYTRRIDNERVKGPKMDEIVAEYLGESE